MINRENFFKIFGINVHKIDNDELIDSIKFAINKNEKLSIAYANANTLNKLFNDDSLKVIYNSFDLIHPDGAGVFLASKFLFGKHGLQKRMTGSDFYEVLISESVKNNWKYYFFGHDRNTLENIPRVHPQLNIGGFEEGYDYSDSKVIEDINKVKPDIIIVGLSCPIQEKWIYNNKDILSYRVILAVGDGIKVFANKKTRGPVFLRKIGMEWFSRFISNPVTNFSKYIVGNPLFLYRVFQERSKLTK